MKKKLNKLKIALIGLSLLFLFHTGFCFTIIETQSNFIVHNDKFIATISKTNGMVESLKLVGSDFEIAADYPSYSIFFPEFLYQYPDGKRHEFYHPSRPDNLIETSYEKFENLIIVDANWINGKIDAHWQFIFEPNKPYFRAAITRTVVFTGVYSNFQQCTMYTPDMDNSFIINYQGQLELTMGQYKGEKSYVLPSSREGEHFSPFTAQHSLWTVFDYDNPQYFPTIAWSDGETNIHAGVIATYTSPNQRESVSYHGGGTTRKHPGFAEAQFNWFGKSDSECLYLRAGTKFSMELYFYQNYGSTDSLWNFNQRLLSKYFEYQFPENYVAASWGGRSSPLEHYYWRFPQVSTNYITSQELWRHKSFAIPQSQNGIWNIHLFSLNIENQNEDQTITLTPIYGTDPLFDKLWIEENDTSFTGGMSWQVGDFNTKLFYTAYLDKKHITVHGEIDRTNISSEDIYLEFQPSPRFHELFIDTDNKIFSFIALDSLLDTVSIGLTDVKNIDSSYIKNDTLYWRVCNDNGTLTLPFKFNLYPSIQKAFRTNDQKIEIENRPILPFKAYLVNGVGNSGISFLPSTQYFIFNDQKQNDTLFFDLFVDSAFDSLIFALDISDSNCFAIITSDQIDSNINLIRLNDHKYILKHSFSAKSLYQIQIKQGGTDGDNNKYDLLKNNIKSLTLYPNPAEAIINIEFILKEDDFVGYKLFDIAGKTLLRSDLKYYASGSQNKQINLTNFASGIYYCKIFTKASSKTAKFVLIK